jgi:tyrosinase
VVGCPSWVNCSGFALTSDNLTRSDLSIDERKEYISAVKCLMSKPAKAPKDEVPGALSRFDDFVATHMTMAPMLHSPANLFAAHRYYIWAYEKALREECGYKGYQPVGLMPPEMTALQC